MSIRIGINGYGRMGRLALRIGWGRPGLEFTQINETKGGPPAAAHLTKYDSVHGKWGPEVSHQKDSIQIDGSSIRFTSVNSPAEIDWKDVDIVLECSGKFRTPQQLEGHLRGGVRKVIVSAPVKEGAINIVMGINDDKYDPGSHNIITAASCTTNCLAPVIKVVHEKLGIRHGLVTTIHDMTNTQRIVDAPESDLRRARAASLSLIPTTTGSATAIGLIYPELQGLLNGLAIRVPLLNASLTDSVFEVARPTTIEEVNGFFEESSKHALKGILGFEKLPLVSIDYRSDPRSAIVDALSTMVVNRTQVKVIAWYDNEWGYTTRMIELAQKVGSLLAL